METILSSMIRRYPALAVCEDEIRQSAALLAACYRRGGKLLLCGNGGSAADCEHIVGELMKGFTSFRPLSEAQKEAVQQAGGSVHMADSLQGGLPAVSLCGHPALNSAFANDVDAALGYAQQVWVLGTSGDMLLGISTSGNAENVCNAAITARAKGMTVLGLTGETGGKLAGLCDVCIRVPERETYLAQEYHLPVYHALCRMLEREFFA